MEGPLSPNSTKQIHSLGFEHIDQFAKADDLEKFIDKLCQKLENRKGPWKTRQAALQIIEVLAHESLEYPTIHEFINSVFVKTQIVKDVSIGLMEQIQDNRSEIIKQCSHTVQGLAHVMNKRFIKIARRIFPIFLKTIGRSNEVIRTHTDEAIIKIIKCVHSEKLMFLIFNAYKNTKNTDIQEHCCKYFQLILTQWPFYDMMKNEGHLKKIEDFIRESLKGKSNNTRHSAAKSFWYYLHHFPERKDPFLITIAPRSKSIIIAEQTDKSIDISTKDISSKPSTLTKTKSFIKPKRNMHTRPKSHKLAPVRSYSSHQRKSALNRDISSRTLHKNSVKQPLKRLNVKYAASSSLSPKPSSQRGASFQSHFYPNASSNNIDPNDSVIHQLEADNISYIAPHSSKIPNSARNIRRLSDSSTTKDQKSDRASNVSVSSGSDIDSIFNVDFANFRISSSTNRSSNTGTNQSSLNSTGLDLVRNERLISPKDLDNVAAELHTEWSFFASQLSESVYKGNQIMNQLKTKENIQSIEKMIDIFNKQKQKIEFILYRFRTAQTACTDVDSCEL